MKENSHFKEHLCQNMAFYQQAQPASAVILVTRRVSEGPVKIDCPSLTLLRFGLPEQRFLVVGWTKDAIRAGTAQTPPLCR